MIYSTQPKPESYKAIADAIHIPYWLDNPAKPAPEPHL